MDFSGFINKKNIIAVCVVIILAIIAWGAYDNLTFRAKSTSPDMRNMPTSTAYIEVSFSQPIKSIESVSLNDDVVPKDNISLHGKNIKINVDDGILEEDVNYSLKLSGIRSGWFNNSIDNLSYDFVPHYVDYDSLSSDQRSALSNKSSSGQIDDPFLNNSFPIITDDYQIEAKNAGDGKTIYVYVTFLKEIPDYDNGGTLKQLPNSEADSLRDKALDTIKQNKGNPQKYKIIYSNKYLNDKYSS